MMGALVFLLVALSGKVGVDPEIVASRLVIPDPELAGVFPEESIGEPEIISPPLKMPEPVIHDAEVIGPTLTQEEVDAPLLARIAALQAEISRLKNARSVAEKQADEIASQTSVARAEQGELAQLVAKANSQRARVEEHLKEAEVLLEASLARLTKLNDQLEEKLTAPRAHKTVFRLLPYDRTTGTQRHPMVIECLADGYRFALENVDLNGSQMRDATVQSNKLLDGINELATYYYKRGENPYVLLVVYPDGIPAFRIARGILQYNRRRWGYELIPTNMPLDWPASPTSATIALQEALDRDHYRRGTPLDSENGDIFATLTAKSANADSGVGIDGIDGIGPRATTSSMTSGPSSGSTNEPFTIEGRTLAGASRPSESPRPSSGQTPLTPTLRRLSVDANRVEPPDDSPQQTIPQGFRDNQPPDPWARSDSRHPVGKPMRRWGKQSPDQWIGYERQVPITIANDKLTWGDIVISDLSQYSSEALATSLGELLDIVSINWDRPNPRVHWRPTFVALDPASPLDAHFRRACDSIDVGFRRVSSEAFTKVAADPTGETTK